MNERASPGFHTNHADDELVNGIGRIALGDTLRRSARRFGDYLTIIYGLHKAGMVWVPISTVLNSEDIRFIVQHTGAAMAIIETRLPARDKISPILREFGVEEIGLDGQFAQLLASPPAVEPQVLIHERDLALIMYTSGTTSRPKGAMHCHLAVYCGVLANIGEWEVTRREKLVVVLPMFHAAAHCLITTVLTAGGTIVLHKGFDAAAVLTDIEGERATMFVELPMMFAAMLDPGIGGGILEVNELKRPSPEIAAAFGLTTHAEDSTAAESA
jgi:long-chain acyl-CoA synthetase